jgi:hypothetical protein
MKREPTTRGALIVAMLAALVGCNSAFAQSAPDSAPGMGPTSPLGIMGLGSTVGPTGIPLGATDLGSAGMSPAPSGTLSDTTCSVMGSSTSGSSMLFDGGGTMGMPGAAPSGMGSPTSGSSTLFDGGGTGTCGTGSGSNSSGSSLTAASPPSSGGIVPGQLGGQAAIPLGATQLGTGGLGPTPISPAPTIATLSPSSPLLTTPSSPTMPVPTTLPIPTTANNVTCSMNGTSMSTSGTSMPSSGC